MALPIVPLVVIGGVAYVATRPADGTPKMSPPVATSSGAHPGASVKPAVFSGLLTLAAPTRRPGHVAVSGGLATRISTAVAPAPTLTTTNQPGYGNGVNGQVDPNLQAALDAAAKKAQDAFDNMSDVEKQRAADTLNDQLKLDPPLNGKEDWKEINKVCETAAGGIAGAAIGAAIGGPIGAKIGALFGAYVGGVLADFVNDYAAKAYNDVKDAVVAGAKDVGNAVEDGYNYVVGALPF